MAPLADAFARAQLADILGTSETDLPTDTPVTALGFDSLMAVTLKLRCEAEAGVLIPVSWFLEGPTLTSIAARIAREAGSRQVAAPASAGPPVAFAAVGPAQEEGEL